MWLCLSLSIEFGNISSTVYCSVLAILSTAGSVPVPVGMMYDVGICFTQRYALQFTVHALCVVLLPEFQNVFQWLFKKQSQKSKVRSQKSKMKAHQTQKNNTYFFLMCSHRMQNVNHNSIKVNTMFQSTKWIVWKNCDKICLQSTAWRQISTCLPLTSWLDRSAKV